MKTKDWIERTMDYLEKKERYIDWNNPFCMNEQAPAFTVGKYGIECNNHHVEIRRVDEDRSDFGKPVFPHRDNYCTDDFDILILNACWKFRDENNYLEPFNKEVGKLRDIFTEYDICVLPKFDDLVRAIKDKCEADMERGTYMFRRHIESYLAIAVANGIDWESIKKYGQLKTGLEEYLNKFIHIRNSEFKENNRIITPKGDETNILEYIAKSILRFAMDYKENFNGIVKNSVWVKVIRHYGEFDADEKGTGLYENKYVIKEDISFENIIQAMKDMVKTMEFNKYYAQIVKEIHQIRISFKYVDVLGMYIEKHKEYIIEKSMSLKFENKKACFMFAITSINYADLPFETRWKEDIYNIIKEFALNHDQGVKDTFWLSRIAKELNSKLPDIKKKLISDSGKNYIRWSKDFYDKEMNRRAEIERKQKEERERRKTANNIRERERSNAQIRWFGYFLLQGMTAEQAWHKVQTLCL